jgi:hypothetical protein
MLTPDGCRSRRHRFRHRLDILRLDAAVLTDHRDIYEPSAHSSSRPHAGHGDWPGLTA